MKTKFRRVLSALLLALLLFPAFALSETTWRDAYKNLLVKDVGVKRAASLVDMTGDGVPELLLFDVADNKSKISLYTFSGGQARAIALGIAPFSRTKPKGVSMQMRSDSCVSIVQSVSGGSEQVGIRYSSANGTVEVTSKTAKLSKNKYYVDGNKVTKSKYDKAQKTFAGSYKKIGTLTVKSIAAKDKASAVEKKFTQLAKAYTSFTTVKTIKLNKTATTVTAGKTYQLKATRSPSTAVGAQIVWSSSDTAVATVDANGKVTAISGGKATITATATGGAKKSCKVTVKAPAATSVSLSRRAMALTKGETASLGAAVLPAKANQMLKYASSDETVASVSASGVVTAIGKGKAKITLKAHNGKSSACDVVVTDGPVVIVDISQHNYSSKMDWQAISKSVDLLILRCGVTRTDTAPIGIGKDDKFAYYAAQCKKYGIPFGVYYYGKSDDEAAAADEARMTYSIASAYNPLFYVYDAEEARLTKSIIETYMRTLKSLGAKKTGYYIAHHRYSTYKLDTSLVDFIWLPHYGSNTGEVLTAPAYPCDLHQYSSNGRVDGFPGRVDVNRLMGTKDLSWFLTR